MLWERTLFGRTDAGTHENLQQQQAFNHCNQPDPGKSNGFLPSGPRTERVVGLLDRYFCASEGSRYPQVWGPSGAGLLIFSFDNKHSLPCAHSFSSQASAGVSHPGAGPAPLTGRNPRRQRLGHLLASLQLWLCDFPVTRLCWDRQRWGGQRERESLLSLLLLLQAV